MKELSEKEKQQKQAEILESHKKLLQNIGINDFELTQNFSSVKYKNYEVILQNDNLSVIKDGNRISFEDIYLSKIDLDEKIHDIINILEDYRIEKNMSMLLTPRERFEKSF